MDRDGLETAYRLLRPFRETLPITELGIATYRKKPSDKALDLVEHIVRGIAARCLKDAGE